MARQRKVVDSGGEPRTVEWALDVEAIKGFCRWAATDPPRLRREVDEMMSEERGFSGFIFAAGLDVSGSLADRRISVPARCAKCGEVIVFRDGLRCVGCGRNPERLPEQGLLACVGRIACDVGVLDAQGRQASGGPFLGRAMERMRGMDADEKARWQSTFFTTSGGHAWFSPAVYAFFTSNWPHTKPHVIVHRSYFEILDIQIDHVYPSFGDWYRLCLYSAWHEATMRTVLTQRAVPRLYIDVMFADLAAVGRLQDVMRRLGTTMHQAYNMIGREGSERFKAEYNRAIADGWKDGSTR